MRTFFLAAILLFLGYLYSTAAGDAARHWSAISALYAACGVAWFVASPVMFLAGLWVLLSRGRRPLPFLLGGAGAILAGVVMLGGVLSYVIPCSGAG